MDTHEMKDEFKRLWKEVLALEVQAQSLFTTITETIASVPLHDLVDCGFMAREFAKVFEALRKASTIKQETIGRFLAAASAAKALQGEALHLEGEMARATVDVVSKPRIPAPRTAEWVKLLQWLGVPDDVIRRDVLRPSFRALTEEVTKRMAAGDPLPPGIKTSFSDMLATFTTKLRGKMAATEPIEEDEF